MTSGGTRRRAGSRHADVRMRFTFDPHDGGTRLLQEATHMVDSALGLAKDSRHWSSPMT